MNGISLGNTFFNHKTIHKKTWISPDGSTETELDYFCINNRWRTSLHDVKVYRGADIGSDHHLVVAKIRLKFKIHKKAAIKRPVDTNKLKDESIVHDYQVSISNRYEALEELNLQDIEDQ